MDWYSPQGFYVEGRHTAGIIDIPEHSALQAVQDMYDTWDLCCNDPDDNFAVRVEPWGESLSLYDGIDELIVPVGWACPIGGWAE